MPIFYAFEVVVSLEHATTNQNALLTDFMALHLSAAPFGHIRGKRMRIKKHIYHIPDADLLCRTKSTSIFDTNSRMTFIQASQALSNTHLIADFFFSSSACHSTLTNKLLAPGNNSCRSLRHSSQFMKRFSSTKNIIVSSRRITSSTVGR